MSMQIYIQIWPSHLPRSEHCVSFQIPPLVHSTCSVRSTSAACALQWYSFPVYPASTSIRNLQQ